MLGPRKDYLSVDDTFMAIAKVVSERSKDPNTQVGAIIVDKHNQIISVGYNGFPKGINNYSLPWDREGKFADVKYNYISHAEESALDNAEKAALRGSRIYITLFPCNVCAVRLINCKIKEIIYLDDKYHDTEACIAARKLFDLVDIRVRQFKSERDELVIKLK